MKVEIKKWLTSDFSFQVEPIRMVVFLSKGEELMYRNRVGVVALN